MRFLLAFLAALVLMPALASAHDGVHVENAYALETAPGADVGAVFMDIGAPEAKANDKLLKVVTPRASRAEIHTVTMNDMGVAKMRPLDSLVIPMGKTTALKQGGDHIMLMGLTAPLVAGETFPMTLTFERGETIDVNVMVKKMGDDMPMQMHSHEGH